MHNRCLCCPKVGKLMCIRRLESLRTHARKTAFRASPNHAVFKIRKSWPSLQKLRATETYIIPNLSYIATKLNKLPFNQFTMSFLRTGRFCEKCSMPYSAQTYKHGLVLILAIFSNLLLLSFVLIAFVGVS